MLYKALKMLRIYYRFSQKELAKRLDISNSHLSELENNKKSPSLDLLSKYSDFFMIRISSLMLFAEKLDHENINVKTIAAKEILKILEWIGERNKLEEE